MVAIFNFFKSEISGMRLLIFTMIIGKLSQNHGIILDLIKYASIGDLHKYHIEFRYVILNVSLNSQNS